VKARAKGAFTQKDMTWAELLYGKAIQILDELPEKREATLYSNRAMVRLNLNKVQEALDDANMCLQLNPSFSKGHHRKAQALLRLKEWDEAIAAATVGAQLDDNAKAFTDLIEKAKADKAADMEAKANLKRDAQDVRVELHNASTARVPPVPKKEKIGAEDVSMRGYKTREDGKITSYFHTEYSQEAKDLIEKQGYGKPKRIDGDVADPDVKGGGSQWNIAGTYEEKSMMKWVGDKLKEKLVGLSFPSPQGSFMTTAVEELSGDATVSVSRGKRRHMLGINFSVKFEVKVDDKVGSGKIEFVELSLDDSDSIQVHVDSSTRPELRGLIETNVNMGLQPLVLEKVNEICAEYAEV